MQKHSGELHEPLISGLPPGHVQCKRGFGLTTYALMVKNVHVKRRHYIALCFELLLPFAFVCFFTLLKHLFSTKDVPHGWSPNDHKHASSVWQVTPNARESFCPLIQEWRMMSRDCKNIIALAAEDPHDTSKVHEFQDFVTDHWCSDFSFVSKVYKSADDLQHYLKSGTYARDGNEFVSAAIVFSKIGNRPGSGKGDNGNVAWDYSIRLNVSRFDGNDDCYRGQGVTTKGPKVNKLQNSLSTDELNNYAYGGFEVLQKMVNRYIINSLPENSGPCARDQTSYPNCESLYMPQSPPIVSASPIRDYTFNPFYDNVLTSLSLMYLMAFLYPLFKILSGMVEEKEFKIKEGMSIMGVPEAAITLSWYLTYLIIYCFTTFLLCIVCKFGLGAGYSGLFPNTDFVILFLFFLAFGMSVVAFCFMIAAFFSKAKVAGVCGVVVFFAGYFGYYGTNNASAGTKAGLCFLPQIAFALGIESLGHFEAAGLGITRETAGTIYDEFAFQTALICLIIDVGIYTVLGWYLNKVVPREWGVVLPWYFPFTKAYWLPATFTKDTRATIPLAEKHREFVEDVAPELEALKGSNRCVEIRGLVKEFDTPSGIKTAVDNLDLTMYEGQIFALLGHNGAGKTTTINMLSGMLPITSGTARVLGMDVQNNMAGIRQTMGVCPQHDVLFADLTVREHLEMFGRIKGIPSGSLSAAVQSKIEEVGLVEKTNVVSKFLSGGQKRKLSVAIALLGDSRVVFLDEPTSGMDPYSRRFTWDVLRKNREGRIMVLTTHFMDEADLLGDRIAIMGQGQLRCCGSSLFLKNRYGQGYNLTFTKKPDCNEKNLTRAIRAHVSEARLLSNVGTEVTYQMPVSQASRFPALLNELDANKDELAIQEYGISITTMEEIFIRVARDGDVTPAAISESHRFSSEHQHRRSSGEPSKFGGPVGARRQASILRQVQAVLIKRALTARRDGKAWLCSLLLPLLLVVLGLSIIKFTGDQGDDPSIILHPSIFDSKPTEFPFVSTANALSADGLRVMSAVDFVTLTNPKLDLNVASSELWGIRYLNGIPCKDPSCHTQVTDRIPYPLISSNSTADVVAMGKYTSKGWYSKAIYGAGIVFSADLSRSNFQYSTFANTSSPHASVVWHAAIDSAIAFAITNGSRTITARSHPLPVTAVTSAFLNSATAFTATIFIMIAISFIPATFVAYIVREREGIRNAKHLQLLSGCEITSYWIANYLWDLFSYIPFFVFVIILVKAFGVGPMINHGGLGAVIVLFFLFGCALIPFTYLVSYLFDSASSAQNWTVLVNFLINLILTLVAFIMGLGVLSNVVHDINDYLKYLYRLFPGFCVGDGLYALALRSIIHDITGGGKIRPWDWDICGASITFLAIESALYTAIVVIIDVLKSYPSLKSQIASNFHTHNHVTEEMDEDVKAEEQRLENIYPGTEPDAVVIRRLRKSYGHKVAVKDLQFGIGKGECFGLLGINGAGKTTTLKMLTGDVAPSSGSAKLAGLDVLTQLREVRKVVGYCPQFDALTDLLSVREHLELYCRLKGVPERDIPELVEEKLKQMDLKEFEFRLAHTLSGGNKRKLSVAIAIIGNPPIIFLDEPSTGMDPVARRFMWNVIADISTSSKECTVILTTHSMEECEALCTKVAIMVGGRFRCFGNIQRLKARFGQGFTVEIKTTAEVDAPTTESSEAVSRIIAFFEQRFTGSTVVESSATHVVVRLPQQGLSVGGVFDVMEANKHALSVAEYSVSQTTLEQIFNAFASQQEEEKQTAPGFVAVNAAPPSSPFASRELLPAEPPASIMQ